MVIETKETEDNDFEVETEEGEERADGGEAGILQGSHAAMLKNLSNTKAWFICFDYFVGDGIYSSLGFRLAGGRGGTVGRRYSSG